MRRSMDATLFHYRDSTNLEVDAIVAIRHGDWCAFEVKLGTGQVDQAAAALLKFRDRMDLNKCGEPTTLGVIVSTGYGYMRKDGVAVIPIGALGAWRFPPVVPESRFKAKVVSLEEQQVSRNSKKSGQRTVEAEEAAPVTSD